MGFRSEVSVVLRKCLAPLRELKEYRARLRFHEGAPPTPMDGLAKNASAGSSQFRYLFISGLPRSGTTALMELLNLSADVALYDELYGPWSGYGPTSFRLPNVFFAMARRPWRERQMHQSVLEKSKVAGAVGEKSPLFVASAEKTLARFPPSTVKVVHIFRPILDVAASYQRRADDASDQWRADRGMQVAIDEMNRSNQRLLALDPAVLAHFSFINYADLFFSVDRAMALFAELGVCDADSPELRRRVETFMDKSSGVPRGAANPPTQVITEMFSRIDVVALANVQAKFGARLLPDAALAELNAGLQDAVRRISTDGDIPS